MTPNTPDLRTLRLRLESASSVKTRAKIKALIKRAESTQARSHRRPRSGPAD